MMNACMKPQLAHPLLQVSNLVVEFMEETGSVRAVDGVGFELERGQTLCIVGESGSGKSVTSLSIMRLMSRHTTSISGQVMLEGVDLLGLPQADGDDFSRADDLAQPRLHCRRAACRKRHASRRHGKTRGASACL